MHVLRRFPATSRPLLVACLLLFSPVVTAPNAARAADPFYLELLRDGSRELRAGNHAEAQQLLQLACFGLLEEPAALAGCLVQLSLAQAGVGERNEFVETFDRLVELERRFQAFTDADIAPDSRAAFTDRAVAWVPVASLSSIPALADAWDRKTEGEVAALPPDSRRRRLAELQTIDPTEPRWARMLAELELVEGNATAAATSAAAVLALDPDDDATRCIQGRARAALGQCQAALADLPACSGLANATEASIDRLECLSALSRWQEAATVAAALPPEAAQQSRVRRITRQIEKEESRLAEEARRQAKQAAAEQQRAERDAARQARALGNAQQRSAQSSDQTTSGGTPPAGRLAQRSAPPGTGEETSRSDSPPPSPSAGTAEVRSESTQQQLTPTEQAALDQARSQAQSASLSTELSEPMRIARPIADRYPENRDAQYVVAEIAYRARDWRTAIRYFDRGGEPGADQPVLLFYQAISLYETGDRARAADVMRKSLTRLERNPWVDSYVEKILGSRGSG